MRSEIRTYTMVDLFPDLLLKYVQDECRHLNGIDYTSNVRTDDGITFYSYPHCIECGKRLPGRPMTGGIRLCLKS